MTTEEEMQNVQRILEETVRLLDEGRTAECREFLETAVENLARIMDTMRIRNTLT
jgi:hypothetical protein